MTSSNRPDPDTIRAWDRLVSHTPRSDVRSCRPGRPCESRLALRPGTYWPRRADRLVGGAGVLRRRPPVLGVLGYVPHGP
ncbi:MAG: hypothetical protein ACRDTH_17670 [Pseudonocardiaceae bacterium]